MIGVVGVAWVTVSKTVPDVLAYVSSPLYVAVTV